VLNPLNNRELPNNCWNQMIEKKVNIRSCRAITDTVSVAFAKTVLAKSNIYVNPIQALVWAKGLFLRPRWT
jgi:hypothetical protein